MKNDSILFRLHPLPWTVTKECEREIRDANGVIFEYACVDELPDGLNVLSDEDYEQADSALANLWAAAPDLLAALKDLIGWMPGRVSWHTDEPIKAVERAKTAIAKAEGEAIAR